MSGEVDIAGRFGFGRSSCARGARRYNRFVLLDRRILRARHMAGQENAKDGALAFDRIDVNKTAGLLDDPVNRRKPEPGALADLFG